MPRILNRRISLTKRKKKKKKQPQVKSTKEQLQLQQSLALPVEEEQPNNPPLSYSSHSGVSAATNSSTDSSSAPPPSRYVRGGGYCSHRTYEERWSDDHFGLVIESWNMTPAQGDKLLDLKERVQDVDHMLNDPHQLVYFLKDELGNVELAEVFFRKTVQSRKESPYQMDSILEEYELPDDYDHFPICVLRGVDKDGDPIHVVRLGVADCWGLYKRHGREAMIKHAIYYQELDCRGAWVDDYEAAQGKKATQFTVVFDLQGLSYRHLRPGLLPVCATAARLLQDHYPEMEKRLLIIRAPSIFKMVWGLVKHFFDPGLRDLMIFGTSDANSEELMDQFIDQDVLPRCIHSGGQDGVVARGFEHVKMEGGMLPQEGEYKTPRGFDTSSRQSRTGDGAMSDLSDTMVTSNVRTSLARNRAIRRATSVQTKCTKLMSGSFDIVPKLEAKSVNLVVAQEYRALINQD